MDLLAQLLREEAEKGATSINLSDKKLDVLPPEVLLLKSLMRIGLAGNRLDSLPLEFSTLSQLKYVNLKNNLLQEIPSALCQLTQLEILDVSKNQLVKLPDRPGFLMNVRVLNLSRNNLSKLPLWMGNMKNLEVLQVNKNPINWPPEDIVNCPSEEETEEWLVALKNYLKNFKKNEEKENREEKIKESEDKMKNLINILQEALNVQLKEQGNLRIFTATNTILSVMDVFFRTFLAQARTDASIIRLDMFEKLQASTLKVAYCAIGFEKMDEVKEWIKQVILDLKEFLNSLSLQLKSRNARFHMFGYYCMSNDLEKGILDLLNPELKNSDVDKTDQTMEILAQGKSLLFSLSDVQGHQDTIKEFETSLDELEKTNDFAAFTEVLLDLVKSIDPRENKDILRQSYDLLQSVQRVL
jgi:hypothetical protein